MPTEVGLYLLNKIVCMFSMLRLWQSTAFFFFCLIFLWWFKLFCGRCIKRVNEEGKCVIALSVEND